MKKSLITFIIAISILAISGLVYSNRGRFSGSPSMSEVGNQDTNPTPTPLTDATPNPSTVNDIQSPALNNEVVIDNFAYKPASIAVKKGTQVKWTNKDIVNHTVTAQGNGPDSELFGQNEEFVFTFTESGTFEYICKPHPYMKGTVVVVE
jgi:plastocyanin